MEIKDLDTMTARELNIELIRHNNAAERANAAYKAAKSAFRNAQNMPEGDDVQKARRTIALDETRPVFEAARRTANAAATQAADVSQKIHAMTSKPVIRLTEKETASAAINLPLIRAEAELLDLDGIRERIQGALMDDDRAALHCWSLVVQQRLKTEPLPGPSQIGTTAAMKSEQSREAINGQLKTIKERFTDERYTDVREEAVKVLEASATLRNQTRERQAPASFSFIGTNDASLPTIEN